MKWLKVYGLPKLPLFLARWAMKLGLPGPTWYKWKAASAGTGVILDEMIRAADDLGYDGQKVGKLAMTRIDEKAMVQAINPNVKLSYTEKRTTGGHTCRGVYQYRDEELGDGPAEGAQPE